MSQHQEGFYNVPRNPILGGISDFLARSKTGFNDTFGIPGIDIGIGLGDMIFGESPELFSDLSHGADLWKGKGFGGRMDTRAADVAGLAGLFGSIPKNLAKGVAKGSLKNLSLKSTNPPWGAQKGYIQGIESDLADMVAHAKGLTMRAAGASTDEIWDKTKWWFDHPDGKARFEVAHGDERYLNQEWLAGQKKNAISQSEIDWVENLQENNQWLEKRLKRSKFMEAYPGEKGKHGFWNDPELPSGSGHMYKGNSKVIEMDQQIDVGDQLDFRGASDIPPGEVEAVVAHEVQHLTSYKENFSPGGNSNMILYELQQIASKRIDKYKAKLKKDGDLSDADWDNLIGAQKDWDRFDNPGVGESLQTHVGYLNLADESQARLVESRMHMSQKEMDADRFYERYDRDFDKMVRYRRNKRGEPSSIINPTSLYELMTPIKNSKSPVKKKSSNIDRIIRDGL